MCLIRGREVWRPPRQHQGRRLTPADGTPAPPAASAAAAEEIRTLTREARDHYQRALDAQRQGNWALYGEEIKRLGDVLQRMEGARR